MIWNFTIKDKPILFRHPALCGHSKRKTQFLPSWLAVKAIKACE